MDDTHALPTATTPELQPNPVISSRYKPKSRGKLLMEITAMSGEYPAANIPRMMPAKSYARKVILNLLAENLIREVSTGGLKGYRLTPTGKRQLVSDNPDRFAGFLAGTVETNKIRAGYDRRLRLHSLAETCTLMYNAGIAIFADVKPKVYLPDTQAVSSQPPVISAPCFYTSREQKGQDDNAIRGSRAAGTLLTPTRVYAIYNTGNAESRWSEKVEQRYRAEVQGYICRKLMLRQYNGEAVDGILIGEGLANLEKYLIAEKKQPLAHEFFTKTYQSLYFITNDTHGEVQLRLLCDSDRTAALRNAMLKRFLPPDSKYPVVHDAMTEDGNPVLFCCLLDIPRLIKFQSGAALQKKIGKVIAFDFQLDLLERFLKGSAEFVKLRFDKFVAGFFQK